MRNKKLEEILIVGGLIAVITSLIGYAVYSTTCDKPEIRIKKDVMDEQYSGYGIY
jgi:hypothetical protein